LSRSYAAPAGSEEMSGAIEAPSASFARPPLRVLALKSRLQSENRVGES